MRLDKYLSNSTALSRKQARQAIKAGRVEVDGKILKQVDQQVSERQQILFDQESLQLPGKRYYMLHKPAGLLSATQDSHQPTVLDLMTDPNKQGLHLAGRLDKDTTGLVLISDDGHWTHSISSPHKTCYKRYRVSISEPLLAAQITQLEQGVMLKDESQPTRRAQVELISERCFFLSISEGKYHQVKRMLAAVGHQVTALHRDRIGTLELDAALQPGQYRALTNAEIALFL